MDDRLRIVERPMTYQERIGQSKLRVLKDGVLFLRIILEMTLMWQPARLFTSAAVLCFAVMTLFAMHPIERWLRLGRLEEDVIYRLLFCWLMGAVGMTLLSAGLISDHLRRALDHRLQPRTFSWSLLNRLYTFRGSVLVSALAAPVLVWLVGRGAWTWITDGYVEEHWSRVVLAGMIVFGLTQMFITVLTVNVLRFHAARKTAREPLVTSISASATKGAVNITRPMHPSVPAQAEPLVESH